MLLLLHQNMLLEAAEEAASAIEGGYRPEPLRWTAMVYRPFSLEDELRRKRAKKEQEEAEAEEAARLQRIKRALHIAKVDQDFLMVA
jgi:hypothetical protein